MDQSLPNQQEPQQPEKKGLVKPLSLLEVGLIEFFFVAIVLILLFGTLNYFNILKLSAVFPKHLGFLPHRAYQQKANNTVSLPEPTPKPIPTSFAYDTQKAENLLATYLKDNIKPDFLPSKIEVKHRLIASGKQAGTDYEFGANWTINNIFFQSNFHYQLNSNNPTDMEFSIQPQGIKETTANTTLAKTLTATYLKNVPEYPTFECGTFKTATSFCENFSTTDLGKAGFGLVIGRSAPNITLIFSCFIPKDSAYYQTRTSCLLFREKIKDKSNPEH